MSSQWVASMSKFSSHNLVAIWLHRENRYGVTNSDLNTKCKQYWDERGIYMLGSRYERAFRKLRSLDNKPRIVCKEETRENKVTGQRWKYWTLQPITRQFLHKLGVEHPWAP